MPFTQQQILNQAQIRQLHFTFATYRRQCRIKSGKRMGKEREHPGRLRRVKEARPINDK